MKTTVYRSFTLRAATAEMRVAKFQDRDHIVVPVVALVEGVLFAHNAPAPELVTEELFAKMPGAWNGRPIVINHPEVNGRMVSASQSPSVLERELSGTIFNSRVENHRLLMEAWIDLARVAVVGEKLAAMVARIEAKDEVEISIGAIVVAEAAQGAYRGRPYSAKWIEYAPDHLALLEEGAIGACSREMGCGIRAAHAVSPNGGWIITGGEDMKNKALLSRVRDLLRLGVSEEEMSDRELRRSIDAALRAKVPGYLGVVEVVPGHHTVVYEACPEDTYLTMQQDYSVDDAGVVTLTGDGVAVEPVTEYRPVTGAVPRAACGCQSGQPKTVAAEAPSAQGGSTMKTKAERVAALIANPKTIWKPEHRAALEASDDAVLLALEEADAAPAPAEAPAPVAAPVVPAAVVADAPAPVADAPTLESLIAKADPDVREAFASMQSKAKADKAALVKQLTDSGRCGFTAAQLAEKDATELKVLVGMLPAGDKVVSFAGRGLARESDHNDDEKIDAPPSLDDSIRAARAAKQ